MTLAVSSDVIQDRLHAISRAIDGGATAGLLLIYDGARPGTAGQATSTQKLLVSQPFGKPSAGSASGGTLTLALGAASTLALKTGSATWARITDGDGKFVADMDVTAAGGAGEVQLSAGGKPSTQVYEGGVVSITLVTFAEA